MKGLASKTSANGTEHRTARNGFDLLLVTDMRRNEAFEDLP